MIKESLKMHTWFWFIWDHHRIVFCRHAVRSGCLWLSRPIYLFQTHDVIGLNENDPNSTALNAQLPSTMTEIIRDEHINHSPASCDGTSRVRYARSRWMAACRFLQEAICEAKPRAFGNSFWHVGHIFEPMMKMKGRLPGVENLQAL